MSSDQQRLVKPVRWAARAVGIVVLVFFLTMLVGETVVSVQEEGLQAISAEGLFIVVPVVIALAAFVISWWWERAGGFLLVLAYLVLSLSPTIRALLNGEGLRFFSGMWLFGLPFFVAGVLFLICSWLSRKASPSAPPPTPVS
ncbi:MAG: hypothetical protein AB1603_07250 [Chloroflexota bacterium]